VRTLATSFTQHADCPQPQHQETHAHPPHHATRSPRKPRLVTSPSPGTIRNTPARNTYSPTTPPDQYADPIAVRPERQPPPVTPSPRRGSRSTQNPVRLARPNPNTATRRDPRAQRPHRTTRIGPAIRPSMHQPPPTHQRTGHERPTEAHQRHRTRATHPQPPLPRFSHDPESDHPYPHIHVDPARYYAFDCQRTRGPHTPEFPPTPPRTHQGHE